MSEPTIYPQGVYDTPSNLLGALGTFWSSVYAHRDQVESFVAAKSLIESQTQLDTMELIASISRFTVPIFHRDNWYSLTLRQSERNDAQTSLLRYDAAGLMHNDAKKYDLPDRATAHAFPAPPDLADVRMIFNRFTSPSLSWTSGSDFVLDGTALVLRINPFEDTRVAKRPVYQDGEIVDYECVLWLFRGDFDYQTVYRQFGYILGARMKSSSGYRDLMNAVFDAIVGGTTRKQVVAAFSAITGVPVVREQEETVEDIALDHTYRLIITDKSVYRFHPDALPTVAVGDVVHAGDTLVDALQFFEFNRGITPDELKGLAIGRGLLASCFLGDLVFSNKEVPLEVITDDPSGFTKLQFSLGGIPTDVAKFFDELHQRGVAAATSVDACYDGPVVRHRDDDGGPVDLRLGTLAHFLDRRPVKEGEPAAGNLPATINPLQFLVANVLRNNAFVVRIRASQVGPEGLGLHNVRLLRKITPPHTAMIVVVELTATPESVTVDRVTERISTFTATEPRRDSVPASLVNDRRITIRVVSGSCQ